MSDYVIPAGWKFNGSTADQTTFTLPGHTVTQPRLAIFDRKVPSFNGQGTQVPSFRFRIIRGVLDSEGKPYPVRATIDATIRWPLNAAPADLAADMALFASVMADAGFQDDATVEQVLPR